MEGRRLFLVSGSESRRSLLRAASISFEIVQHSAVEMIDDCWSPDQVVILSCKKKRAMACLPEGKMGGERAVVLVADTVVLNGKKMVSAAYNREQARQEVVAAREGSIAYTGFILDLCMWNGQQWDVLTSYEQVAKTSYAWIVPDDMVEPYLDLIAQSDRPYLVSVEGYGLRFLRSIDGLLSTIQGLPMFALCDALKKIDTLV